jgi:hypothetical protein
MTVRMLGVTKTAEAVVVTVAVVAAELDRDWVEDAELKDAGVNGAGSKFGHVGWSQENESTQQPEKLLALVLQTNQVVPAIGQLPATCLSARPKRRRCMLNVDQGNRTWNTIMIMNGQPW